MLGIAGDLLNKRVMAWEVDAEMDVSSFEKEVRQYVPFFTVSRLDSDNMQFNVGGMAGGTLYSSTPVSSFIYVDLSKSDYIHVVSRYEFFQQFKRAF